MVPNQRFWNLIALVIAMTYPTLLTWAYFLWFQDAGGWQGAVYGGGKVLQFVLPVFWLLAVLREPPIVGWRPTKLGWGLAFGGIIALAIVGGYYAGIKHWLPPQLATLIQTKLDGFGVKSAVAYAAVSLFYCGIHSLLEEYYWRWFVFRRLEQQTTPTAAIVISGLSFMAHHVVVLGTFFGWSDPRGYICSLGVAIGGWFWAWLYRRNGYQLLAPWLSHLLVDGAIFWVGFELVRGSWG